MNASVRVVVLGSFVSLVVSKQARAFLDSFALP